MKDLEKMIEKWKKIFNDKKDDLEKRTKRKLGIKDRKRAVVMKNNVDSDVVKIGK